MKTCTKCKISKDITEFGKHMVGKNGLRPRCKVCRRADGKAYRSANPEKVKASQKAYVKANPEKRKATCKAYREDNPEKVRASDKSWYASNPDKVNALTSKRRATKLNATPPWADLNKIAVLYKKAKELESITGLKYHVDHVVPLRGATVCGLHVWENLQILEASLNISKGNR